MKKKKTYQLRALRLERKITLQTLSAETGIPQSTISALERGKGWGFRAATKHTLSDYFKVAFFDLWPEELEKIREVVGGHFQLQMFFHEEPRKD